MRLTRKLVIWFLVCVAAVLSVNFFFNVRSELERYEQKLMDQSALTGRALRASFTEVLTTEGEARAEAMLSYADKRLRKVDIRWVDIDASPRPDHAPHGALPALGPLSSTDVVHLRDDANDSVLTYVALRVEHRPPSALELSAKFEERRAVVRGVIFQELRTFGAILVAATIASTALGIVFVGRPVARLASFARRVGSGDLSEEVFVPHNDELYALGLEMNTMCRRLSQAQAEKLAALEELRHAERLATVGKLASGLAHELGTPLNVVLLRAKMIAAGSAKGDAAAESARYIVEQGGRMKQLVRQLLDFARHGPPRRDRICVREIVERTVEFLRPAAAKQGIALAPGGTDLAIIGDAAQLEQVVTNLVMNAIQAGANEPVELSVDEQHVVPPSYVGAPEGRYVCIRVTDHGAGMDPKLARRIFEPFFTTKEVGEGTGLGLAVCWGIVQDHGGWVAVDTEPQKGSTFRVYFPKVVS